MRQYDIQLEKEVAELLEKGELDRAWIRTTYISSAIIRRAIIRRVWYTRVKAAIGKASNDSTS